MPAKAGGGGAPGFVAAPVSKSVVEAARQKAQEQVEHGMSPKHNSGRHAALNQVGNTHLL